MAPRDAQVQYEEALFALLMTDLSADIEKEAWAEYGRLKEDTGATVPLSIHQRCLQTIRQEFKKKRTRRMGRTAVKTLGRIAVILCIISLLFAGVLATSEQARVNFLNLMIEIDEKSTTFYLSPVTEDTSTTDVTAPQFTVGWIPEGYVLDDEYTSALSSFARYSKSETECILIQCALSTGGALMVDTEDALMEDVLIHGVTGTLVTKQVNQVEELQLVWLTEDQRCFVIILASNISREDILQIANGLEL